MKSVLKTFVTMLTVVAWGVSTANAAVYNVSTSAALQAALDKAVAGDEIILADGSYSGEFYIRTNNGTSSAPITVRAANKHKAIMQGNNACDRYQEGFVISKSWWIIKDLKFRDHGRAISVYASNVEVHNNVIDHFREEGIRVENTTQAQIHDNVVSYGDGCQGDAVAIYLVNNADNNKVQNNIIFATGDNGYTFGSKRGYGLLIADYSDDNLVQGNLLFANGGKGTLRILGGKAVSSVSRNIIKDNALLWGEGEQSTGDCVDDSNQFLNNIFYSTYQAVWSTKGNFDGTKGNHVIKNNLFFTDAFSRIGASLGTGGEPFCDNPIVNYKINNVVQNNVFFSPDRQSDWHRTWLVWGDGNTAYPAIKQAGNNLFWAVGNNPADWVYGYSFRPTDIHAPNNPPKFTNPLEGDFSLASGSPGKNSGSDGKDIGVEYNTYLKKEWLKNAFTLATQEKQAGLTSTFFAVNPVKFYQVWFYIPESSPYQGIETFTVEGQALQRDIKGLTTGNLEIQPGGPARWITLGRHRATDGTLNISWSNSSSASKFFIRELPTADEAYSWISGASTIIPPTQPPPTASLAIPGRIELESFNTGGEGVAYHDTTSTNLGGAYRTSEGVDIKLAPGGAGYTIGYTDAGEWLKYDVNVTQSGIYTITVRGANGAITNGTLRIEVDGVNVTGTISIPPTGSYSSETTVTGPSVSLAQGAHSLRVYMEGGNFDLNWIEFTSSSVSSAPAAPGSLSVSVGP